MKRTLVAVAVVAMLSIVTACSDHAVTDTAVTANPSVSGTGTAVTKAQIAGVLWGTDAQPTADAKCVAGSHFKIGSNGTFDGTQFTFDPNVAFDIVRMPDPNAAGSQRVEIVSAINIAFEDPATDGRGSGCTADGALAYTIAASADAPIDIDAAQDLTPKQNLYYMATDAGTSYPKCPITAYFDKGEPSATCAAPASTNKADAAGDAAAAGCTEDDMHPIKFVVDSVDCQVKSK